MKKELKDILEAFKKVLFAEETPPGAASAALVELKAKDGTVYGVAKLETGEAITVNGAPAPDGNIELEDGKVIVVADGIITAINDAPANNPAPAQMKAVKPEEFEAVRNELTALKETFTGLQAAFAAIQKETGDSKTATNEKFKAVFEFYSALANESTDKADGQGANFSKEKTEKELKREALKAAFSAASK